MLTRLFPSWRSKAALATENAVLRERLERLAERLRERSDEAHYWRTRSEKFIDGDLALQGLTTRPVMEDRPTATEHPLLSAFAGLGMMSVPDKGKAS